MRAYRLPSDTLRVPIASGRHRKKLGMTGMVGSRGVLKTDPNAKTYAHVASSVRIDDLVKSDVCLLKADVEGPGFDGSNASPAMPPLLTVATLLMEHRPQI